MDTEDNFIRKTLTKYKFFKQKINTPKLLTF